MFGGKRRDRQCAERLSQFDAVVHMNRLDVLRIDAVYQNAQRGTKVILTNLTQGLSGDAWLWWFYYPNVGDLLAAPAGPGWGPHNTQPILYVGSPSHCGVMDSVNAETIRRALRHRSRTKGPTT